MDLIAGWSQNYNWTSNVINCTVLIILPFFNFHAAFFHRLVFWFIWPEHHKEMFYYPPIHLKCKSRIIPHSYHTLLFMCQMQKWPVDGSKMLLQESYRNGLLSLMPYNWPDSSFLKSDSCAMAVWIPSNLKKKKKKQVKISHIITCNCSTKKTSICLLADIFVVVVG